MSNGSGPNIGCWWLWLVMKMSWRWDVSASLALCVGNPPVTGRFPSQRTSEGQHWYFVWCYPEQTVEKTFKMLVSWEAMTPMWCGSLLGLCMPKACIKGMDEWLHGKHHWVIITYSAPRYLMFNLNSGVVCQGKVLPQITTCLWHRASQFEFNNDTIVNSLASGRLELNFR